MLNLIPATRSMCRRRRGLFVNGADLHPALNRAPRLHQAESKQQLVQGEGNKRGFRIAGNTADERNLRHLQMKTRRKAASHTLAWNQRSYLVLYYACLILLQWSNSVQIDLLALHYCRF